MKKFLLAVCFVFGLSSISFAETYKAYHDRLSDCYYNKKPFNGKILTKAQFEKLHSANWKALDTSRKKGSVK